MQACHIARSWCEGDEERDGEDGFADVIEHFAAGVQTEVYGPADRRQAGRE